MTAYKPFIVTIAFMLLCVGFLNYYLELFVDIFNLLVPTPYTSSPVNDRLLV